MRFDHQRALTTAFTLNLLDKILNIYINNEYIINNNMYD